MEKPKIVHVETEEQEKYRRAKEEKEREMSVEAGANWILASLKEAEEYGERIPLKKDRSFDIPGNVTELPLHVAQLVRSSYRMENSQKGLYDLTREISKKHPELKFSFVIDPGGKWIEYSVRKQSFNIGDQVMWESQGSAQWEEPKKIKSIHKDPKSGRVYAFVEGVNTGMPLDELFLWEKG